MGEETTSDGAASEPGTTPEDSPALRVIDAFGGIQPMAGKLGAPISTVQGWKARGVIPASRHEEVRAAARSHEITLDEADLTADGGEAPAEAATEAATEATTEATTEAATEATTEGAPEKTAAREEPTPETEAPDDAAAPWASRSAGSRR